MISDLYLIAHWSKFILPSFDWESATAANANKTRKNVLVFILRWILFVDDSCTSENRILESQYDSYDVFICIYILEEIIAKNNIKNSSIT